VFFAKITKLSIKYVEEFFRFRAGAGQDRFYFASHYHPGEVLPNPAVLCEGRFHGAKFL
jgi:hypothetical protein